MAAGRTKESTAAERERRELEDRFIACWGEISALWGVNRSIGRIHALLFLSPEPLDAETITERLGISHGNGSTSLQSLLGWGVIRRLHVPGERRARYEAEKDSWEWFHTCTRERRRREIRPVVDSLHSVRDHAVRSAAASPGRRDLEETRDRIGSFVAFMDEFVDLIDVFLALGHGRMGKALRGLARFAPKGRRAS